MSIFEGLEAAAETLRKADKIPEYKEILEAMGTIRGLEQRLHDAAQKIRSLEAEIEKRSVVDGPLPPFGYFFDKQHPDSPLCPKCYQAKDSQLSFMGPAKSWSGGIRRACRICGLLIYEEEMDSNAAPARQRRPYSPFS